VGNLFLTGARIFTGSFEAAIYLLGSITGVKDNVEVIPAINSNFSYHISAGLRDGTVIVGQNNISHPIAPSSIPTEPVSPRTHSRKISFDMLEHDKVEDANLPGSLPTLRKQNIDFRKEDTEGLSSPIDRIWYINPYGQEIRPSPNSRVVDALDDASCVIFSIGSLYTSILPCLILRDVGAAIADPKIRFKILILNGCLDRETPEYTAKEFIGAIVRGCCGNESIAEADQIQEEEWKKYVTHIVFLEGPGTPYVDRVELRRLGIEAVRVYGRRAGFDISVNLNVPKNESSEVVKSAGDKTITSIVTEGIDATKVTVDSRAGMFYDGAGLGRALEAILGGKGDRSRRNTLIG
jgi:hypothetical protein